MLIKSHFITEDPHQPTAQSIKTHDDRILSVNDSTKDTESIDLTGHVVLPAFINAHSHLELTALGPLKTASPFVSWIHELIGAKNTIKTESIAQGIQKGFQDMMRSGVGTIGDHISFDTPLDPFVTSPLKGLLFGEVIGVGLQLASETFKKLAQKKSSLTRSNFTLHPSPHSAHSVHPDILKEVFASQKAPLSIHLAESEDESKLFSKQKGDLFDFIKSRGGDFSFLDTSGLGHLNQLGVPLSKILVVHGNLLSESDFKKIKEHHLSIVHCPRSRHFLNHPMPPLKKWLENNINVALGTDSLASNHSLSFLDELRFLRETSPELTLEQIFTMATMGGAKALQMDHLVGSITPGKKADLIAFKLVGGKTPLESVLCADKVSWMMLEGKTNL